MYQIKLHLAVTALVFLFGCGGGGDDTGTIPPFSFQTGVAVADLNGDGLVDVVVARTYVSGRPPHPGYADVYLQRRDHTFSAPASYVVGSDPWDLTVRDIDGDGKPDIVVANTSSSNISILRQDPVQPGLFLPAHNVAVGGTPYSVAVGDLNGDGHADIAVALQNTGGGVAVLLQDPAVPLSFPAPLLLSNGTGTLSVALGDLNHDGLIDIALTSDNTVQVFFQSATPGRFQPLVSFPSGMRSESVAIADINADGWNDLVVANAGSSDSGRGASVSVLLQNTAAPGDFSAAVASPTPDGARQIAVAQLTGGTEPDIAVVSLVYQSQGSSRVTVLRNGGDGSFTTAQVLNGPFGGNFLAIGDINGDGLPDIVVNDGPQVMLQDPSSPGSFRSAAGLP